MTTKQKQKQQTNQKILNAAASLFREDGYKPTRIDHIMDSIGMTVGGFYNHFESKEDLFRAVVENTISPAIEGDETDATDSDRSIDEFLDMYLSKEHRDNPALGCIAPCLSAEIARSDDDVRKAFAVFVNRIADKVTDVVDSGNGLTKRQRALAILSMCVGSMLIARAVNDEKTSNQVLTACRKAAKQV